MKKLLFPLAVATLLCSACSPLFYQQIATLSSENVDLKDNGAYAYEDGVMTIEYDFWSEYGKFTFVVKNNSDDDIYLNLAESYFVNNGYAQDYYQARTYVVASEKGTSIEFAEKAIVCIPAHSYKVFEEFSVAPSVFRECGFVRDPFKKEDSVREFTGYTSPRVIENRLVFNMGDVVIPVANVFYVSHYQNISEEDATDWIKVERCDGHKTNVKVHKLSANNRFYITYSESDLWTSEGSENDRRAKSFGKSSTGKFNDGL